MSHEIFSSTLNFNYQSPPLCASDLQKQGKHGIWLFIFGEKKIFFFQICVLNKSPVADISAGKGKKKHSAESNKIGRRVSVAAIWPPSLGRVHRGGKALMMRRSKATHCNDRAACSNPSHQHSQTQFS